MEREEKRRERGGGEEKMVQEQSQNSPHTTLAEMLDQRDYERTQVPKIIGNYRLGKTLGVGAYCKVKVATHLVTKEKFAIKILQPQAPQNWVEVEREIEILQQIQHPNIIRIHDVLWSEGEGNAHKLSKEFSEVKFQGAKIYIVVELAQGGELWEHISASGPLDEDMARRLFRQLVSGLEYCHMHLICHRDLKLENILLDKEYNVKINDFGLSNFIHPGHSMHTFCGTLAYAAPEILSQQAYVGFFVDIWSLGIILFAMLTGDVPWALDDEERKATELRNLLAGKFRLPAGMVLSHECLSLLQIMLQPNPKNRATLAQIRTHPWTNKGFGEPPPRVFENYPRIMEVEESILSQISLLGLNANKARRSILNNEPCPALCLYHTLLKKQLRSKRALPPLHRSMEPPRSRSVSIPPPAVSSAPPSPTRSPLGHSPTEDHQQQMLQEEFARKLQVSLAGVQSHERERGGSIVGEVMFLDPRARSTDFSHAHNLAPPKKTALSAPPTPTSHNLTSPPSPHAHTSPPSPKSPRTPNSLTSPPSPHAYSSPPSPTLTPHNALSHSLTSPRSAQPPPPRRKLSTMQLEPLAIVPAKPDLSPTAANTPLPPPLTPVEQEAKKEKKDPILRSLFNKFRGSTKLAPLEA